MMTTLPIGSATEEMTSTINEIARNSEKARAVTGDAVTRGQSASERVGELGKAAQGIALNIAQGSRGIEEVNHMLFSLFLSFVF